MAHEKLSETASTEYIEGTLLLDQETGITYRAQEPWESFFTPGEIRQEFAVSLPNGRNSHSMEVPKTAKVIWTPEEAR